MSVDATRADSLNMREHVAEVLTSALRGTYGTHLYPSNAAYVARGVVDALLPVVDAAEREAAARALDAAADDPAARLSGHSGVSVRWLRGRADALRGGGS